MTQLSYLKFTQFNALTSIVIIIWWNIWNEWSSCVGVCLFVFGNISKQQRALAYFIASNSRYFFSSPGKIVQENLFSFENVGLLRIRGGWLIETGWIEVVVPGKRKKKDKNFYSLLPNLDFLMNPHSLIVAFEKLISNSNMKLKYCC